LGKIAAFQLRPGTAKVRPKQALTEAQQNVVMVGVSPIGWREPRGSDFSILVL
jgi:hypothetical protein